jgi:iron complex outermembrane receptor protein
MFKNIIITFLALVACIEAYSQKKSIADTTYTLKEASVSAARSDNFNAGSHTEIIDSSVIENYKNKSLNEILSQQANLFVKSYGQGSLATLSLRGTGAAHTAVIWNGFNLQSPMNGASDIALISNSFIENLSVQYGGSGALLGSGAVGGAIFISDKPRFNNGLSLNYNGCYGSFNTQQQNLGFNYGSKNFYTSLKTYIGSSENNFKFTNFAEANNPVVVQKNAAYLQWGVLNENYLKFSENQQISIKLWYQNNFREIPPLMTQTLSKASQKDESYRVAADWQRTGKYSFFLRTALFYEDQKYNDTTSGIFTNNIFITNISEFESRLAINKNHLLNLGINNTYNLARSEFYSGEPVLNRTAIFVSYKFVDNKDVVKISTTIRQEYADNKFLPIMPSLGIDINILKTLVVKTNITRNYRLPTLNDLYWNPGGNTMLEPEDGWSEDLGIKHFNKIKNITYEIGATAYNSLINNWIIWLPQINFWSPENVTQVWSRGVESKLKIGLDFKKIKISLSGMYNYTLSTNNKVNSLNDKSLGEQLIYVPESVANINLSVSLFGFNLTYNHVFTGKRYTTSDNSEYLKPYNIGSLFFSKEISVKSINFKVFADINNIWNTDYQAIAWRAMPPLNYRIGLAIDLNTKQLKKNNR